jgi:hypothetical protein
MSGLVAFLIDAVPAMISREPYQSLDRRVWSRDSLMPRRPNAMPVAIPHHKHLLRSVSS